MVSISVSFHLADILLTIFSSLPEKGKSNLKSRQFNEVSDVVTNCM